MISRDIIKKQLAHTINTIDIPGLGAKYEGKVRDCYTVGDKRVLITSDRLSAFDRVLTTIPFKGQLLNSMAAFWFKKTADIVDNHIVAQPHPNVFIAKEVEILPVEVIVRGYLTGSGWRDYQKDGRISGIVLPQGLKKSQKFPEPLITPSTKAEKGFHDMPISSEEILSKKIVDAKIWHEVCAVALKLFARGTEEAAKRGLILVDTKYEFGLRKSASEPAKVLLADEIHTQDSSRYWILETYEDRFRRGEDPEMLDKEFVRRWLIEQGYMGDGTPPTFTDEFRVDVALRYIDACERITGVPFAPEKGTVAVSIQEAVLSALGR